MEFLESIRQDVNANIFTDNLAEALAREAYGSLLDNKAVRYYPGATYILSSVKN